MRHQNKTFRDATFDLDGAEFVDCKFEGTTTFRYAGGDAAKLERCSFATTPRFVFSGAAQNVLGMFHALYQGGFAHVVDDTFANIKANHKQHLPPKH